jgi:hypothetical protein
VIGGRIQRKRPQRRYVVLARSEVLGHRVEKIR